MIGIFKQKNPGNIVVLFVLGLLVRIKVFINPHEVIVREFDGQGYKQLVNWMRPFLEAMPLSSNLMGFFIIFLQANILILFVNTNRLMLKNNYLVGMAYLLLTAFLPEFNTLSAPLLASLFLLLIFVLIFKIQHDKLTLGGIFNAGLLLGIAILIFPPSFIFLFWIFFAFAILRPFRFNEWVLILAGILTPFYFSVIVMYLNDKPISLSNLFQLGNFGFARVAHTEWLAIAIFLALLPLLVGAYYVQSLSGRMLIHVRKAWQLFGVYFLTAIAMSFFNSSITFANLILPIVPLAAFHGYSYYNAEVKIYTTIVFWGTIAFILLLQFYSPLW